MSKRNARRLSGAFALITVLVVVACVASARSTATAATTPAAAQAMPPQASWPKTRAEISNYTVTSSHADVVAFVDSLKKLAGARISVGSIGKTSQGRDLPYVIASRPLVTTPAAARQTGRPVIYIQGNIHSGEVEGKEALQAVLRDLVLSPRPNVLDSVVLIAVPNYNADGNENAAPQGTNRGSQNGPEMVGTRNTSLGMNLNRDYFKAVLPETQASLKMFTAWDPDVFVDLHTSNGSMHGYALTYSPPLNPAAVFTYPFTRDSLLPEIRRRMREVRNYETFDYGNWSGNCGTNCVFGTYDHTPRYGTNYYGMRGRIAILSEAFSHDPFERRVKSTYAFVSEIMSVVALKSRAVKAIVRRADSLTVAWGRNQQGAPQIPVRARLTATGFRGPILVSEVLATAGDTTRYEPGLGRGQRKTGKVVTQEMTIRDRFDAVLSRPIPYGYALSGPISDSTRDQTVALLRLHGIAVQQLAQDWSGRADVFKVATMTTGQYERIPTTLLTGTWRTESRSVPRGTYVVSTSQPLGILALYFLEPESDESVVYWKLLDSALKAESDFPIIRLAQPLPVR